MNLSLEHKIEEEPAKYYGKFIAVHCAAEISEVQSGAYDKIIAYNSHFRKLFRQARRRVKREGLSDFAVFCWGYNENCASHHYID